ncbi:MAG: T9SS type A sorting domain-containing protein [Bacteroidota bacterium]
MKRKKMKFPPLKCLSVIFIIQCLAIYGLGQTPMQVAGSPTITATNSGNWSSPSTWGDALPTDNDRVLIPNGITVTVDQMISEEFKSVSIGNGGKLQFATDTNTELRTEYLFSNMMGNLEIGTSTNKVSTNVKASLVFAERGGTTNTFDPERFVPGAVLMGTTTMHGSDKTSWLTLQVHSSAGDTQFILDSAPMGWQVGDSLVVTGTDPITNTSLTSTEEFKRDEVVAITEIAGNTVTFTPALVRDHKAPAQASDLDVHVANLSRNIVISSENSSVTPISGDFHKPRGHIMFMHTLNVDLRYVEANNLGRTDKTIILDDWDFEDLARGPDTGSPVPNGGKNPRGRYSFHFHRGGLNTSVFPAKPITPLPTPAHVEGCVVNTDPGWGFVNHSSRVNFLKNVSYKVTGGAFNTESGNETGSFIENIAIRTVNPLNPIVPEPRPRDSYTDAEEATLALADIREGRQDFAFQGDGFWLHGTGVTVQGNVVSGCTGHAYVYWTDGLIEKGMGMARGDIDAHVPATEFPELNQMLKDWKVSNPNFVLDIWYLKPRPFLNNTAYGFARGVQTYYVHTEFHQSTEDTDDPEEWFNDLPGAYKDQLDLIFDGTILWNIGKVGFEHNHTANVTIQNSRIVGYNCRTGFENYGINPAPDFVSEEPEVIGLDLDFFHDTHRWNLYDNIIEGFSGNSIGVTLPINAIVTMNGGTFNNSGTDIQIGMPDRRLEEFFGQGMLSVNPTKSEIRIEGDIVFQNPNKNIVMDPQLYYNEIDGKGFPLLGGPSGDEEYFLAEQEITFNFGPFDETRAYYNEQDADYIPITSSNRCSFGDESECVDNEFMNKTNTELNEEFETSFVGSITPGSAVTHAILIGGKVGAATLPIDLVYFKAIQRDKQVLLEWMTSSELNNEGFEVQHSKDGKKWKKLRYVKGNGTTTAAHRYETIDYHPNVGSNYYRLKQMDFDGNYEYSNVEHVNIKSANNPVVSIFPNPSRDIITIEGDFENASIQVFSVDGKLIRNFKNQNKRVKINLTGIPNGIYFIKIVTDTLSEIDTQRIILSR